MSDSEPDWRFFTTEDIEFAEGPQPSKVVAAIAGRGRLDR
jgi:hypothetical protein